MKKFNSAEFFKDERLNDCIVYAIDLNSNNSVYDCILKSPEDEDLLVSYDSRKNVGRIISPCNPEYSKLNIISSLGIMCNSIIRQFPNNKNLELCYYEKYAEVVKCVFYDKVKNKYELFTTNLLNNQKNISWVELEDMDLLVNRLNKRQLKISLASLNIKNSFSNEKCKNLKLLIDSMNFGNSDLSILGLQEVSPNIFKYLDSNNSTYSLSGKGRLSKFRLFSSNKYNEYNPIITSENNNYAYINEVTHNLRYKPSSKKEFLNSLLHLSLIPRIATVNVIRIPSLDDIVCINTHLDSFSKEVQKKQFLDIINLIDKYKKSGISNIIVMGRFNIEISNDLMLDFVIKVLMDYDLEMVPFSGSTNNISSAPVDYIFVPKSFVIEESNLLSDSVVDKNGWVKKITCNKANGLYCTCNIPKK